MNTLSGNGLTIGQSLRPNYQMQIAGRDTPQPGGIPNRPYEAPKEDPKNPYVPAPKRIVNTPQDGPYPDTPRYKGYKEAGDSNQLFIRDKFIDKRGKDIFKLFTGIDLAKRNKKNKELTIYEEAAKRDAFRDMSNEPYDPDEGRMGGGFDIMNDLLDGV